MACSGLGYLRTHTHTLVEKAGFSQKQCDTLTIKENICHCQELEINIQMILKETIDSSTSQGEFLFQ